MHNEKIEVKQWGGNKQAIQGHATILVVRSGPNDSVCSTEPEIRPRRHGEPGSITHPVQAKWRTDDGELLWIYYTHSALIFY